MEGPSEADYAALSEFRFQIRRFLHFSEEAARDAGLEPQQHQALLAIRGLSRHSDPTVGRIAEHLLIRHNSAVELIDRLCRAGLARRLPSQEDRRQVCVRLTARGRALLQRLSVQHQEELRSSAPALVEVLGRILRNTSGDHDKQQLVPARPAG